MFTYIQTQHLLLSTLVIMLVMHRRIKMFKIMHSRYGIMKYISKSFRKSLPLLTSTKYGHGCFFHSCYLILRNPTLLQKFYHIYDFKKHALSIS